MKTVFPVLIVAWSLTCHVMGQGTISPLNSALTRFKLDSDSDGIPDRNVTVSDDLVFGYFSGPIGTEPPQLFATAQLGQTAGVLTGLPSALAVEGTQPGQAVLLQVRGWSASFGLDWQTASRTFGAYYGETKIAEVVLGPTDGPGAVIWQTSETPSRFTPLVIRVGSLPSVSLHMAGVGMVAKSPDQESYGLGSLVEISASPARWHVFSAWNDGVTINPRTIIVTTNSDFTAIFNETTPLENLEFDGSARLAPIGMPAFRVNGQYVSSSNFVERGSMIVTIFSSYENGRMFFTTDGSRPDLTRALYRGPFLVRGSGTIRAIAYNADFSQAVESDPLGITVLPTIRANTSGGGRVTIDPPSGPYLSNGVALVTAIPDPGWVFLHWLGDETATNSAVRVTMNENKCLEAVFGTALNFSTSGSGEIAASPISDLYPFRTRVRLMAIPAPGHYFVLWANAGNGSTNPLTFTLANPNMVVTAVFANLPLDQESLTVIPVGPGSISITPIANRYARGTNITIMAVPDQGQSFIGWTGDATGTSNPLIVRLDESRIIHANFTKRPRLAPVDCASTGIDFDPRMILHGEIGSRYAIEYATSLGGQSGSVSWSEVLLLTNKFGSVQLQDAVDPAMPQRFYRARLLP